MLKHKILFLTLLSCSNIYSKTFKLDESVTVLPFFDSQAALSFIKPYLPSNPVIIEAGAYDGLETYTMSKLWPDGTIYAFEPVPRIYQWLTQNTKSCNNVFRYMSALSNKDGFSRFYLSEDPDAPNVPTTSGSLLPAKEHLNVHHYVFKNSTLVKTVTLDSWAQKNDIKNVDLLWLDMQGHELEALKHATNLLKSVKVVYTEAEFIEAYAGQPLYDEVVEWFDQNGFKLIAQDAKEPSKEHWCCNCVFVKK